MSNDTPFSLDTQRALLQRQIDQLQRDLEKLNTPATSDYPDDFYTVVERWDYSKDFIALCFSLDDALNTIEYHNNYRWYKDRVQIGGLIELMETSASGKVYKAFKGLKTGAIYEDGTTIYRHSLSEKRYVYLMSCPEEDHYKIGVSKNPVSRLAQLRRQNIADKILMMHSTPMYYRLEYALIHIDNIWGGRPSEVRHMDKQTLLTYTALCNALADLQAENITAYACAVETLALPQWRDYSYNQALHFVETGKTPYKMRPYIAW